MRNGRGFDSDHDQKSVEFPRIAKSHTMNISTYSDSSRRLPRGGRRG